jgi:orotidine-5'-phosphate decarboxylase
VTAPFADRVLARTRALDTRLVLGLDPRLELHRDEDALARHTLSVLEACGELVACVKPQLAFFEALGWRGLKLLDTVCASARRAGIPVLLDAKRGDIGSTAEAYARAWLAGEHAGDAVTVNPYLGWETLAPFVRVARENGGAVFVLVKTSNPGSADLQDLDAGGRSVALHVAREVARLDEQEPGEFASVGAVVGATHPGELAGLRAAMPRALLLLPGLGAQGGEAARLAPAFRDGVGALASASRAIQYASPTLDVAASVTAARGFRDALNAALAT